MQWSSRRYTISSSYRLNDHCISGYDLVPTSDKTWYGSRGRQVIVNVYWSSDNRSSNWAWCIDLWSVNVAYIGVTELRSEAAVGTKSSKRLSHQPWAKALIYSSLFSISEHISLTTPSHDYYMRLLPIMGEDSTVSLASPLLVICTLSHMKRRLLLWYHFS